MNLNLIGERYGFKQNDFVRIQDGFQNSIYSYHEMDKDYIIRITTGDRRNLKQLNSEVIFISGLAQANISVSVPILSKNSIIIETIQEEDETFYVTVFERAKGYPIQVTETQDWNDRLFYEWGKIIGKMHHHSFNFAGLDRPEWKKNKPDLFNLLPRLKSDRIAQRYLGLLERLKMYQPSSTVFGLIHNDFHQGNFFINDGKITVFDFDDCAYHWFSYDLAVSYYHAYWQASSFTPENKGFSQVFWKHFLSGYKTEHSIHRDIIEQIPIFLKIREIFLYVLFQEKWDFKEDWQVYTLNDLKERIENDIPYSDTNFKEIIDSLI